MWHLRTWFSGGLGNDGLMLEADDLRSLLDSLLKNIFQKSNAVPGLRFISAKA